LEREGTLQEIGGFGPNSLSVLCHQALKDLERVDEAIIELDLMFSDCPAYVRPLIHKGFRAKMGISLRDWATLTELMLELHRDLERSVLGHDEETFQDQAQAWLDNHDTAMRVLNMLFVNLSGEPRDADAFLLEHETLGPVVEMTERQTDAIATLITTLEMLREPLAKRAGINVSQI
jgi:hypothetical protein